MVSNASFAVQKIYPYWMIATLVLLGVSAPR
jgi:hypothetical protein